MDKITATGIMLVLTFFSSLGMLWLKMGAKNLGKLNRNIFSLVKKILNLYIILGVTLHLGVSIVFVWLLQTQELSFLYPLSAMNYFFVTALSSFLLKEKMTRNKWGGLLFITIGVVLLAV